MMQRRRFLVLALGGISAPVLANTGPAFEGGAGPHPSDLNISSSVPGFREQLQGLNDPDSVRLIGFSPFAAQAKRFPLLLAKFQMAAGLGLEPLAAWQFPNGESFVSFLESRTGAGMRFRWVGDVDDGSMPGLESLLTWVLEHGRTGALLVEGGKGRVAFAVPPPADLDPIVWWRTRLGLPEGVPFPGSLSVEERRLCLAFWETRAALLAVLLARGLETPPGLDRASHELAAADMAAALWRMGEEPTMESWLVRLAHRRLLSGFYHRRLALTAGGTAILQAVEDGRRLGEQAKNPDLVRQVAAQRAIRHARRPDEVSTIELAWSQMREGGGREAGDNPVLLMGQLLEDLDPRVAGEAQRWVGSWMYLGQGSLPRNVIEAPPITQLRAALTIASAVLPEEQRSSARMLLVQIDHLERQRGAARTRALQIFREQGLAPLLAIAPPGLPRAALLDARIAAHKM